MNIVKKIFHTDTREGIISATSALGIIANLFISLTKIVVGTLASSIAIVSEGVNNAADAMTSILTLVGTKLAGKHPNEKHPFGYGRIEYLTSLVISILILITGTEMLVSSVKLIFKPEEMSISVLSILIVAVSAVIKFFLGLFTIRMGKTADSKALEAVGLDCRNDSFVSILTILSAVVFLVFHFSVDAYVGVLTSLLIVKTGLEVLRDTVSDLLGNQGEEELAREIYSRVRSTDGILGAADMMIHNYGPERYSGSVNIEIDHNKSVGEIYQTIHRLQLEIMHELNVVMVFGIYAVDNDGEEVKHLRKEIAGFVRSHEHVKSFHALYIDKENNDCYCDLIVDYKLRDWETLEKEFKAFMGEVLPGYGIQLTIETEYV